MANWYLVFRDAQKLPIARWEALLSSVLGPTTTTIGEWSGNPRDFYSRSLTLAGQRDDVRVEMGLLEHQRGPGDPEQFIDTSFRVTLYDGPFANRLAIWHALRDAFASVGCKDVTLADYPDPIIEDATAAGQSALVDAMRAEIKRAADAAPPGFDLTLSSLPADEVESILATRPEPERVLYVTLRSCTLRNPEALARFSNVKSLRFEKLETADIEAALAAHPQPEIVESVTIGNCKLRGLPSGLAQFTNLETLAIDEIEPHGPMLRALSLAKLGTLSIRGIRRLTADDVAGSPRLALVDFEHSPLEDLDPDIIDACPNIHRAFVAGTPLSNNEEKMKALWWRWPRRIEWSPPRPASIGGTKLRPYVEALLAAPADDAPRLALAAYLTERRDDGGTRIREACELDEKKRAKLREQVGSVPPRAPRIKFRSGGALEFCGAHLTYLTLDEIRAVIDSRACASATSVVFENYRSPDIINAAVAHLAHSGAFRDLRSLHVAHGLTDGGARSLLYASGLDKLEHLDLGDGGVSDAAVAELARSSYLPALRTIRRVVEHRPDAPDAREDEEVVKIPRGDGSMIESIIGHWIFP